VLSLPLSVRIWVATAPVDLRKGFDGLAAIVENDWRQDLYAGHLFVFFNKGGNRCKVLFWDRGGLVVYFKRLEQGKFRVVRGGSSSHVQVDGTALTMLLDGIDISRVARGKAWSPRRAPNAA
jgi:transposase